MTQMEIQTSTRTAQNGYKVDVSRGQRIGRVSSEWFNRPADERYLSLTDLHLGEAAIRAQPDPHRRKRGDPRRGQSR